jgi:phospholipid transport system transporter-binding protein
MSGAGPGFAADAGGARWVGTGDLTFANAGAVHAASLAMPLPTSGNVALGGVTAVDSSTVALLVALKRRAAGEGRALGFADVPGALTALAGLYGVEEMLVG